MSSQAEWNNSISIGTNPYAPATTNGWITTMGSTTANTVILYDSPPTAPPAPVEETPFQWLDRRVSEIEWYA